MGRIKASARGLEKVDRARNKKGWNKDSPIWADEAKTSPSTLKRFWSKNRIEQEAFVGICHAVGEKWEEIMDDSEGVGSSQKVKWMLEVKATLSEIDEEMMQGIVTIIKELSGDVSVNIEKVESGSVVIVLSSYLEGFERIEYLFSSGQLTEVMGFPILGVRVAPVNLSKWLQNDLVDAMAAGWQTIAELFAPPTFAFRADAAKQAKLIELEGERAVILAVETKEKVEGEIDIRLVVYATDATGDRTELPSNLKLTLLSAEEEILEEVEAGTGNDYIEQELSGMPGEKFQLKISLDDTIVREYFEI